MIECLNCNSIVANHNQCPYCGENPVNKPTMPATTHRFKVDDIESVIKRGQVFSELLTLCSHRLALTGSRFFGHADLYSDWDLFTDMDVDFAPLGFTLQTKSPGNMYYDMNAAKVWRHKELKIDLQIVLDFRAKVAIQQIIKDAVMDGRDPRTWTLLYKAYQAAMLDAAME